MDAHSWITPSGAATWVICGQSPRCSRIAPPPVESDAARRGTAAHEGVEKVLRSYLPESGSVLTPDSMLDYTATNGVQLNREDIEAMRVYVRECLTLANATGGLRKMQTEQQVIASDIHPDLWGTLDFALHDGSTLHIKDYKHGVVPVDVVGCLQLVIYAIAKAAELPEVQNFVLQIVQPRRVDGKHVVNDWTLPRADLMQYVPWLKERAENCANPDAPYVTGKHCANCDGLIACPMARQAAEQSVFIAGRGIPYNVEPVQLGPLLELYRNAAVMLKAFVETIEPQMMQAIKNGSHIEGWSTVTGKGKRKWKNESELETIAAMVGDGIELFDKKPVTPAEAERRNVPRFIIDLYTETPDTGQKLVQDDKTAAKKVFQNV